METPRTSIVVPLYNARKHVGSLVDALKAQTDGDFEALLFDDGSSDGTAHEVREAIAGDARFQLLVQENAGPGTVRNRGIEESQGAYLLFVDADDHPSPYLVEHATLHAEETGADIVVFQARHRNEQDGSEYPSPDRWDPRRYPPTFSPKTYPTRLFRDLRNWPWDKLFRRQFLVESGIRFPQLYRSEDLAFTCEALARAGSIALLDEELYTYRVSQGSSSTDNLDSRPLDYIASARELKKRLEDSGLMPYFGIAYADWVSIGISANLLGLKTPEGFETVYHDLHEGSLKQLAIDADAILAGSREEAVAGTLTGADVARILEIVRDNEVLAGAFEIGNLKAELVRRDYEDWRGFRIARAVSQTILRLRSLAHR